MDIKDILKYDPETGKIYRRDKEIGTQGNHGYLVSRVNTKLYLHHRLAFYLMTGEFPKGWVDHINRNRTDNRWENLREVTPEQNNFNRSCKRELPLGVYERVRKGRPGIWYETKIQLKGKQYSSYFRSLDKAIAWRKEREKNLFQ